MTHIYYSRVRTLKDNRRDADPFPKLLKRHTAKLAFGILLVAANVVVGVVRWANNDNLNGTKERMTRWSLCYISLVTWLCGIAAGIFILCMPPNDLAFR